MAGWEAVGCAPRAMEISEEISKGSELGRVFHKIVENSLNKSKSNISGKIGTLQKVI